MKTLSRVLATLLLLLLHVGAASAQSSDYQIIDSFKKRQQTLMDSIKVAQDLEQCRRLENEIGLLAGEFEPHRTLLGHGLYPSSLEASIDSLRDQLKKSSERITLAEENKIKALTIEEKTRENEAQTKTIKVISTQNEEFRASNQKLTQEVRDLSAQIQQLSDENAGLAGTIKALRLENKRDKESIARLQQLTDKLNANIRDRDELIVKMMDSLFDEYAKADLSEMQKKNLLAIAQDNDYVSKIVTTIDGNIEYVQSALLTPADVQLIRDQQRKISAKWEEIKPYVGKIYPDEQSKLRDISMVDGRLSGLKKSTEEAIWKSIHQVFADNSVPVEPFRSAGEMYANLLAYLDEQLKRPSREAFRTFKDKVWDSPIKDRWLPLIPTDELTEKQRSDIDERVALWDKKSSSRLWLWVLAGVIGAAVIALVVVKSRGKGKPALPA